MIPVYVSNGAFVTRYNQRDFRLIPKMFPLFHADGVEFLMYESWNDRISEIRSLLASSRIPFPVTHMDKEIGELLAGGGYEAAKAALNVFDRDIETALYLGSKKLVMHLWNGVNSDSRFSESLKVLPEMYERAEKRGLLLTVENVTCVKNISLDHLARMSALVPGARFTYDTKMAYLHRENELLGTAEYDFLLARDLIAHLHVNDTLIDPDNHSGRLPIMHIGDGKVDFKAFFSLLKTHAFSGTATVESTSVNPDGSILTDKLNTALDAVRAGLNA